MFTHLHVHTAYSFLDGYCHIPKLVSRAKELGMTSLAITDHNHMGGIYEFQKECQKQGIKPILGFEGYQTWNTEELAKDVDSRWADAATDAFREGVVTEEEAQAVITKKKGFKGIKEVKERIKPFMYDTRQYHLILLAMNQTGLNNLIKLQSEAAKVCTYNGRFLFDMGMLRKYSEGVICTTACVANIVAKTFNKGDRQLAETLLKEYKDIFKDRFYLEVQPNNFNDQVNVNNFYMEMHDKYDIPLIATSDVHYVLKTDNKDHDVLVSIGTGTDIYNPNRMKYDHNYWLKSEEEMQIGFKDILNKTETDRETALKKYALYLEAMNNTQVIANMVEDVTLGSSIPLMPKLPNSNNTKKELRELAYKGLYELAKRYKYIADDIVNYEKRLAYELNIINYKNFADYMLIVREFINWADTNNIMTGMGRGSAAGSLVLWCIGITKNVDPIKYDLLFGRFLTIDRTGLPDIDSDVSYFGRDKVIEHIKDLYGFENVAHIGTYTQQGVKSGLKDVGRALKIPFEKMNLLSKQIDDFEDVVPPQPKFKDYDALKDGNESEKSLYKKWQKLESENKELFRLARNFEGLKRNFGVHASGVLAMPCRVDDYFPTRTDENGVMITLFTGVECEELGTAKLDILGLKTLSIIEKTLDHLHKDVDWLYDNFDIEDKKLYQMLACAKSDCIFQLESDMFKDMMINMRPTAFNDIAAATALG
jgi:DNA polymerase III, alpha subunit